MIVPAILSRDLFPWSHVCWDSQPRPLYMIRRYVLSVACRKGRVGRREGVRLSATIFCHPWGILVVVEASTQKINFELYLCGEHATKELAPSTSILLHATACGATISDLHNDAHSCERICEYGHSFLYIRVASFFRCFCLVEILKMVDLVDINACSIYRA